ncbi:F-box/kelch-repeat protein At5g42350-like [Salvia miltiorrhiza]|uniref:F-box/kelch-repeat protein At5g42350-like n=1 Tax=Salvia miltiorrhiza TaxID=226208 RepID=UPI0025AD462F|nr:F-box/kelch-repeat protein At5g42350-like [Salvia miltiorrhiza]XP_057794706.1 F-box/kelch-repeat protein At5g42350-like [Salvia miltiorrhiza]XP_057794707.1 F-box/kelch-repeat protein At5g42350-like [Salvia miltiorrhiza]
MTSQSLSGELIDQEFVSLSVSKRLVRSMSQKWKRKSNRSEGCVEDETTGVSLRCLTLYGRGGGCKVGADTGEEFGETGCRRRSSASDEAKGSTAICGNEEAIVDCFSYGVKEKFWRKNNQRLLKSHESQRKNSLHAHLPDDVLEMCLVRLPLRSLMNARLVCKKWRNLTTTHRFMLTRRECSFQSPWLFLFGVVKNGFCMGEIHALDVSLNEWHKIDSPSLKGRFLFSVSSIHDDIYIVGGRSSLANFGRVDRSSFKTHRGVIAFNPLTKSSRKAASMNHARSSPVLGISEVNPDSLIIRNQVARPERRFHRSRVGGVLDVYEDPHRLSVRRQTRSSLDENESAAFHSVKQHKSVRQKQETCSHGREGNKFVLIAVGGLGSWDEPLDSGEIYDPVSNKWTNIQRLPLDFGVACSGVMCNGIFYVYSESDRLAGYDIEQGYWIRIQTTPCPPRVHEYYPKLVSCMGRLLMLSVSWCEGDGQIGRRNKAIRKLWELDLVHHSWKVVSVHPDAPMDWNALFVADRDLVFGVEMFKIFGQVLDFVTMFDASGAGAGGGCWSHVSRNHAARDVDAWSCMTKSMAVLRL